MDFAAHVQPLRDRFRALDEDDSGRLDDVDLREMVKAANRIKKATAETKKKLTGEPQP